MSASAVERRAPGEGWTEPLLAQGASYATITADVSDPVLVRRAGAGWWIGLLVGGAGTVLMLVAIWRLFVDGVGIWGIDASNVWGFAIANYVWWIGIGNAGTLISCMLLLTRQRWRASINRFAEAMTLFAAAIAGLFPILHLGRPELFYWLVPYPDVMDVWPQWRSPLVWDFFAISGYLLFSALFWYTGALPDLATLRDRARRRAAQLFFGAVALGWRGSARHWRHYESFYWAMAALGVPLVVSVHSVVALDFAVTLMPGWQETIFPPYFVVGAMFSGFAMVVTLAIPFRAALGLDRLITLAHFDAMAKILLTGSLVLALSYATEWFMAWYAGGEAERFRTTFQFSGAYAPLYWAMLACNVIAPQLFWLRAARRNLLLLFVVAVVINVGMWLERILIIFNTLSRGFLPAEWELFAPTFWDWALLIGSLGFFAFLFFLFVRIFPAVSMHEVRRLAYGGDAG